MSTATSAPSSDAEAPGQDSLRHLQARLALVEARVRAVVASRRATDPTPDDPFRGLYLTEEGVDRLLDPPPDDPVDRDVDSRQVVDRTAATMAGRGVRLRLYALGADAGLTGLDEDLLLIAMLPDLDSRFERLYGYLNDDVTRRRATVGLGLELAGVPTASATARARLSPGGPLIENGLVQVEDSDRPYLTRALRVPDRVTAHLLGDDTPDPLLVDVLDPVPPLGIPEAQRLAEAMRRGYRLVYVREQGAGVGVAVATAAVEQLGHPVLGVNVSTVRSVGHSVDIAQVLRREALLGGAGVVIHPLDPLVAVDPDAVRRFSAIAAPVVLVGSGNWDPAWTSVVPVSVDAPALAPADRLAIWRQALAARGATIADDAVPLHFVLGPQQVGRAVNAASATAALHDRGGDPDQGRDRLEGSDLRRGARAQNAAGLERLARRIDPSVGWDDIVLPASAIGQLRELGARARHRDQVLVEWRMRLGGGRGRGVTALFAGDSGTGKTMAAELIAGDLGLDLYTVNLATVVDKYIGETEKNLERIFTEAGGVNAVLLFDEADAIFGKRSEVRDAHDRYANIESAYLLQRMESFDGLAVLSTNLRSNIDDAFTRRLDMIIEFPIPDERARLAIWQRCLRPPVPCADDLDLAFCARSFTMSGGNIRSAATTAGYLAAAGPGFIGMQELIAAVQQEYRKLGRLVLEREFGRYLPAPATVASGVVR